MKYISKYGGEFYSGSIEKKKEIDKRQITLNFLFQDFIISSLLWKI